MLQRTTRSLMLSEEGTDVTVRIGLSGDSSLIMHHLATAHYITCASPQYLAQHDTPTTPTELLQHCCINFIYPQARQELIWKFEQNGKAIELAVDSYLRFDSSAVILEAVIQGACVVQLPKFTAANAITRSDIQPILQSYAPQVGYPLQCYILKTAISRLKFASLSDL